MSYTKKAMISQPMAGFSEEEIKLTREKAIQYLESKGYEIKDTYLTGEKYSDEYMKNQDVRMVPVYYLAGSLEGMSFCNAVYFCRGWENARGCKIEHDVAVAYGLEIIEEGKSLLDEEIGGKGL